MVRVHAQPGAKRTEIAGRHGEAVRVRVTAPPVDGRANAAIAAVLADALGVPRSAVELASGASGRRKRFRVHGTTRAAVSRALAAVLDG